MSDAICKADDCERQLLARGWCNRHYQEWRRTVGDGRECSIEDCTDPIQARGWCDKHYQRWIDHGDAAYEPITAEQRFWAQVDASGDCWIWTGSRTDNGYGQMMVNYQQCLAHRLAYEFLVGAIPEGLTIDHLCRNRPCVNPDHLDPVPQRVNTMRSPIALATINARKTHCKRGHPLSGDNLYRRNGRRHCRQCRSDWSPAK